MKTLYLARKAPCASMCLSICLGYDRAFTKHRLLIVEFQSRRYDQAFTKHRLFVVEIQSGTYGQLVSRPGEGLLILEGGPSCA
eukprot:36269-Eustigmatos_ZCMA.PRE.1